MCTENIIYCVLLGIVGVTYVGFCVYVICTSWRVSSAIKFRPKR